MRRRRVFFALARPRRGCTDDDGTSSSAGTTADTTTASTAPSPATTAAPPTTAATPTAETASTGAEAPLARADWTVQPGSEQVAILDADPGTELWLGNPGAGRRRPGCRRRARLLPVPQRRSGLVHDRERQRHHGAVHGDGSRRRPAGRVLRRAAPALGRLRVHRDPRRHHAVGHVVLPGPWPTARTRRSSSTPATRRATRRRRASRSCSTPLGYAYVGVNMRGTGCSGGSFDVLRGRPAARRLRRDRGRRRPAVGAGPPRRDGRRQVPRHQPAVRGPDPAAEPRRDHPVLGHRRQLPRRCSTPAGSSTPASPSTWPPSGWTRPPPMARSGPSTRIDAGDEECARTSTCACRTPTSSRDPRQPVLHRRARRPRRPAHLRRPDRRAGVPRRRVAGRADRRPLRRRCSTASPATDALLRHARQRAAHRVDRQPASSPASSSSSTSTSPAGCRRSTRRGRSRPILAGGIFGTDQVTLPPDRFTGMTYEEALAAFEADPPIQVLFEEGAADGAVPGTPRCRVSRPSTRGRSRRRRRRGTSGPDGLVADRRRRRRHVVVHRRSRRRPGHVLRRGERVGWAYDARTTGASRRPARRSRSVSAPLPRTRWSSARVGGPVDPHATPRTPTSR